MDTSMDASTGTRMDASNEGEETSLCKESRRMGNVIFQGMLNALSLLDPTLPPTSLKFPIDEKIQAAVMEQGKRNIIRTAYVGKDLGQSGATAHIYMKHDTNMIRPLLKEFQFLKPYLSVMMCYFRHDTLTSGISLSEQIICLKHIENALKYNMIKPWTKDNANKRFMNARRKYLQEIKASKNVKFYKIRLHESVNYMKKWLKEFCCDGYYYEQLQAMEDAVADMTMVDTCAYYESEPLPQPDKFTPEQEDMLRGAITNVSLQQWRHVNTELTERLVAPPNTRLIPACDHRYVNGLVIKVYGNNLLVIRRSAFETQNWNFCALYRSSKMGKKWLLTEMDVQLRTGMLKDIHMWGSYKQGLPSITYRMGNDMYTRIKVKNSQKYDTVVHKAVSQCCRLSCLRTLFMFSRGSQLYLIHRSDMKKEVPLYKIPNISGIEEIAFMPKTHVYVALVLCKDINSKPMLSMLTMRKHKKFLEVVSEVKIALPSHVTADMIQSDKELGLRRIGILTLNNFCLMVRVCVRENSSLKLMEKILPWGDSDQEALDWNMVSNSTVPRPMLSVYGIDSDGLAVVEAFKGLEKTRSVKSVCEQTFCDGLVASHGDVVTITYPDNVVHTLENVSIRHNNVRLKLHRCSGCFEHIERSHNQEKDLCQRCAQDNSIAITNTHHMTPVTVPLQDGCCVKILKKTWGAPVWGTIEKSGLLYTLDCKWPSIQFGNWAARLSIRATESDILDGDISKNMMQYVEFRKSSFFKRFRSVYEKLNERAPTEDQLVNAFNEIERNVHLFQGHPIFKNSCSKDLTSTFLELHDAILKNPAEAYVVDEQTIKAFGYKRVREAFGFENLERMRGIILTCHRIFQPESMPVAPQPQPTKKRKATKAVVPAGRSVQNWGLPLSKNDRKPFLFTGTLLEKQKSVEGEFIAMQDGEMCVRSGCLHAVMSYGKTVWSLHIASIVGWKTLILVPSKEDIDQYFYELGQRFLSCDGSPVPMTKLEVGTCTDSLPQLGICTYASLRTQSDDTIQKFASHFDFVLADEVHTIVEAESKTRKVVERLQADVIIGYSGTPYNESSKIDQFLPVRSVVRYEDMPNLCKRTIVKVRFSPQVTQEMTSSPRNIQPEMLAVLKSLMMKYPTTPKLFMFYRKKTSSMVANLLGVPCVNGDTVGSVREKYVNKMRNGNLKTLVCGKCMWQGVNMPPAAILVRVENWESKQQTNQMFGRVYREHRMKDKCLIIDISSASTDKFKDLSDAKDSEFFVVNAKKIICAPVTCEERLVIDDINT